jgi:hypothetical protein
MSRFRLKHEEQVAIFLRLLIVWEGSFLNFGGIIEVAGDFVLLEPNSVC